MGPVAISTALSGLAAASTRLAVAAENIANKDSTRTVVDGEVQNTPFQPKEVQLTSQAVGGVSAEVRVREDATVRQFNPGSSEADANGAVTVPNVDLAEELIEFRIASYDFKANLKVIQKQDELTKDALNIIS